MSMSINGLLLLAFSWLLYFSLHSFLASLTAKRWLATRFPAFNFAYRVFYNIVSLLAIVPILWFMHKLNGPRLWAWPDELAWLANGLAILAAIGFIWSFRYYGAADFLGLAQLKTKQKADNEHQALAISPLHRHVRHPWYFFGLVILWTRDMTPAFFISALAITTYLIIGSRLEERKLIYFYGDAYREYRRRVPALIPWPGHHLTADEATRLMQMSHHVNGESKEPRA